MADPTKEELLAAAKKLSEKKAALDEREMLLNEQKKQIDVLLQQKAQLASRQMRLSHSVL